jgi:phosphate/phosphite/phosphonate ABC transporter binding protein
MTALEADLIVFGYFVADDSPRARDRFVRFGEALSKLAKLDVQLFDASSYDELSNAIVSGYVDVAWLPPIPFLALDARGAVAPLVHLERGGRAAYESVLIVARDSGLRTLDDVVGTRAAWVEPSSASGFVVPRLSLAARGIDPRTAFEEERFWRTHESVVRAVARGLSDVGATYAGFDRAGTLTRGPWQHVQGAEDAVRVLARVGEVPGDIVAARAALPGGTRERVLGALLAATRDGRSRLLARDAFGVDDFRPFSRAGYEALRRAVAGATADGVLSGDGPSQSSRAHRRPT